MSQQLKPLIKPATAADIPAEWIASVRAIILRDGQGCRAGFPEITIEVQNINHPEIWQPLNLSTNGTTFATEQDRDQGLNQLWGAA